MYLFSLFIREHCIRACTLEATWWPWGSPGIMGLQVNAQLSSNQCSHLLNSAHLNSNGILSVCKEFCHPGYAMGFQRSSANTWQALTQQEPQPSTIHAGWDFHWSAKQKIRWMFELSLDIHLWSVFMLYLCLHVQDVYRWRLFLLFPRLLPLIPTSFLPQPEHQIRAHLSWTHTLPGLTFFPSFTSGWSWQDDPAASRAIHGCGQAGEWANFEAHGGWWWLAEITANTSLCPQPVFY